ncbi:hypothetical protein [Microcystis sp. M061S2]|uniref:hypothetical protein n=1 Tax=Microcystis sp. M061S2 TaxID=2771171 RepID=UPI002582AC78|nr:hypothetical protein [Microcystis sp. M061S2]MCA2656375.1 hypothetical protein [Microcystis sp. M061S2]
MRLKHNSNAPVVQTGEDDAISIQTLHSGRDQKGNKNNNWKGGISKNRYLYKLKDKIKFPLKHRARDIVRKRIKRGTLLKEPCSICKSTERIQAHHEDYSKPLNIIWLCEKCHRKEHANPTVALQSKPVIKQNSSGV